VLPKEAEQLSERWRTGVRMMPKDRSEATLFLKRFIVSFLKSEGFYLLNIIKKLANGIAKTKFASEAIQDGADLSAFKEKPAARNFLGIFLMCCSYIIGLPAVGLIGAFSIYWHAPLLIIIGGPFLLVAAHLVFLAGMYLAGGRYVKVFFRWATRVTLEKLM